MLALVRCWPGCCFAQNPRHSNFRCSGSYELSCIWWFSLFVSTSSFIWSWSLLIVCLLWCCGFKQLISGSLFYAISGTTLIKKETKEKALKQNLQEKGNKTNVNRGFHCESAFYAILQITNNHIEMLSNWRVCQPQSGHPYWMGVAVICWCYQFGGNLPIHLHFLFIFGPWAQWSNWIFHAKRPGCGLRSESVGKNQS